MSIHQISRCRQLTSAPPKSHIGQPIEIADESDDDDEEQMYFLQEANASWMPPRDWYGMAHSELSQNPHLIPEKELVYPDTAPRRGYRSTCYRRMAKCYSQFL